MTERGRGMVSGGRGEIFGIGREVLYRRNG